MANTLLSFWFGQGEVVTLGIFTIIYDEKNERYFWTIVSNNLLHKWTCILVNGLIPKQILKKICSCIAESRLPL